MLTTETGYLHIYRDNNESFSWYITQVDRDFLGGTDQYHFVKSFGYDNYEIAIDENSNYYYLEIKNSDGIDRSFYE